MEATDADEGPYGQVNRKNSRRTNIEGLINKIACLDIHIPINLNQVVMKEQYDFFHVKFHSTEYLSAATFHI